MQKTFFVFEVRFLLMLSTECSSIKWHFSSDHKRCNDRFFHAQHVRYTFVWRLCTGSWEISFDNFMPLFPLFGVPFVVIRKMSRQLSHGAMLLAAYMQVHLHNHAHLLIHVLLQMVHNKQSSYTPNMVFHAHLDSGLFHPLEYLVLTQKYKCIHSSAYMSKHVHLYSFLFIHFAWKTISN